MPPFDNSATRRRVSEAGTVPDYQSRQVREIRPWLSALFEFAASKVILQFRGPACERMPQRFRYVARTIPSFAFENFRDIC